MNNKIIFESSFSIKIRKSFDGYLHVAMLLSDCFLNTCPGFFSSVVGLEWWFLRSEWTVAMINGIFSNFRSVYPDLMNHRWSLWQSPSTVWSTLKLVFTAATWTFPIEQQEQIRSSIQLPAERTDWRLSSTLAGDLLGHRPVIHLEMVQLQAANQLW